MDGYYAWMVVATALVLMMTTPALAMFYGGMTRSKSVLNMLLLSFTALATVAVVFVLWGWSMGWSNANEALIANPFTLFGLNGVSPSDYIFVMFQFTFAAITVALISGSIADRVKLGAWILFAVIWVTVVYFPIAHNVWGGGWLYTQFPNLDYAGGTVVHINAGIAGLALALVIGKRVGWPREVGRPHNVPMTLLGAGLLWFGWYGFNVGSIVFADDQAPWSSLTGIEDGFSAQFQGETGMTFVNTTVATAVAMLAWLVVERITHGKATAIGAASGVVAGLVAITPSCGAVDLYGAMIVGAFAGALCALAVSLKYRFGYDDSLDVVGVHLVGGIVGALLIGFVGTLDSPQGINGFFPNDGGLFYGGDATLLFNQFMGVLFTLVWSGVLTTVIAFAIKYTIGWRVVDEDEVSGIDLAEHGESGYDLTPTPGGSFRPAVSHSSSEEVTA